MGKAIAEYDEAIARAYLARGNACYELGSCKRAIADYNEAIRLSRDNGMIYFNRGVAYSKLGKLELAIKDYSDCIRRAPDYYWAYAARGVAYHGLGKLREAIKDYNKAIQLRPDFPWASHNKEKAFAKLRMHQSGKSGYGVAARAETKHGNDEKSKNVGKASYVNRAAGKAGSIRRIRWDRNDRYKIPYAPLPDNIVWPRNSEEWQERYKEGTDRI